MREQGAGWRVAMLSADRALEGHSGLRFTERVRTSNGDTRARGGGVGHGRRLAESLELEAEGQVQVAVRVVAGVVARAHRAVLEADDDRAGGPPLQVRGLRHVL